MIRASKLQKSYGPLKVLSDVDLEIKQNEFVAILGKSGSGKTTLLSLLAGLDKPDHGEVWIGSNAVHSMTEKELSAMRRSELGFVFQAYHLIPHLTAVENVRIPLLLQGNLSRAEIDERAKAMLSRLGLGERLDHKPSQLSGGEQQRVALARSLIHEPKVLFADEPTGNLDSENGSRIFDLLLSLRGKTSLVVVTHDQALAKQLDRQIHIKDGRIQA